MIQNKDYVINHEKRYIKILKDISPLKITGTRIGAVLNVNEYITPFQIWCEMWKIYKKKIDDKYRESGRIIEKILLEKLYLKYQKLNCNVIQPRICSSNSSIEFFPKNNIFGGRWDALLYNKDCTQILEVIEIKTTSLKNKEEWIQNIPKSYLLQVSLYAYLLNIKNAQISIAFLDEKDYINPKNFHPTEENIINYRFNIYNQFPSFDKLITKAEQWWKLYILTKKSPIYNKNDEKFLNELKNNTLEKEDF